MKQAYVLTHGRYGRPQLDHAILQGAPRDNVPPPHLKDSECAFVELKTHHEAWTGDKSVKRRFKLRNSELVGVGACSILFGGGGEGCDEFVWGVISSFFERGGAGGRHND